MGPDFPDIRPQHDWDLRIEPPSDCGCTMDGKRTCFKHKLRSIQYGGRPKSPQTLMEAKWSRDMPAYKRLRNDGMQPPKIDGCAEIEALAKDQREIEIGHMIDKKALPKIAEMEAVTREIDWNPVDSIAAKKANDRSGVNSGK